MDSIQLFEFIQSEEDDSKILKQLKKHVSKGRKLPWFQDVIPGLIPGVEDSQRWLDLARQLLWTDLQYEEHEKKLDYTTKLRQPDPILVPDPYRLQKCWPVFIEALRPMPKRMSAAANDIYRIVAGQECLVEDRNVAGLTSAIDDKHSAFVTVAVVMQDKIVSPIISDIEWRQQNLDKDIRRAHDQIRELVDGDGHDEDGHEGDERSPDENGENNGNDHDYTDNEDVNNVGDGEGDVQDLQQRLDRLIKEKQETQVLYNALRRFRDMLVEEREMRDSRKDLKRPLFIELSDSDEDMSKKRGN
ncbi:hypothetical protein COCVIDRAFT_91356 [Bipolaris victoriae FI3]|uniref:Uncharacterized protein n=1 Tax=Bipolaris victoriae (strain FI3) TaxID=930091 RepID=W7EPS1_BIPV3|nr:hypothetical protein COCVIDRAFT_91356 [Bipolaris victoriae FI3]